MFCKKKKKKILGECFGGYGVTKYFFELDRLIGEGSILNQSDSLPIKNSQSKVVLEYVESVFDSPGDGYLGLNAVAHQVGEVIFWI